MTDWRLILDVCMFMVLYIEEYCNKHSPGWPFGLALGLTTIILSPCIAYPLSNLGFEIVH
jgi:hypothetical protein